MEGLAFKGLLHLTLRTNTDKTKEDEQKENQQQEDENIHSYPYTGARISSDGIFAGRTDHLDDGSGERSTTRGSRNAAGVQQRLAYGTPGCTHTGQPADSGIRHVWHLSL